MISKRMGSNASEFFKEDPEKNQKINFIIYWSSCLS